MKYKVGDKVRIQPLEWYQKELESAEYYLNIFDIYWCSREMTISKIEKSRYLMEEDGQEFYWTDEMIEGLVEEETKPKLKFKVGDKVRIKSLDWYNKNKTAFEGTYFVSCDCGRGSFTDNMVKYCGEIVTIASVDPYYGCYFIKEDKECWLWTDEMIECKGEEEVGLVDNLSCRWVNEFNLPDGYIFKDENGNVINETKIVLEKQKKEYPKSYKECCKVLDWNHRDYDRVGYKSDLVCKLQALLLCRDAYWKIAGEEMGLDKPWQPEYKTLVDNAYFTIHTFNGEIVKSATSHRNAILAFPTEEMRDAFKENFDPDIEFCKEFL